MATPHEATHDIVIRVAANCSNRDVETAVLKWLMQTESITAVHELSVTRIPPADEASRREVHRLASQLRRSNARIKEQKDGSNEQD